MSEVPLQHREREFKLPWREAGPPNHLDGKVVRTTRLSIKTSLSLGGRRGRANLGGGHALNLTTPPRGTQIRTLVRG